MDTFQSELGVKFEHQLEANHVITDKQVWVGCLGSGPTGVSLLSTYKMTESWAYQDEIGRLVLDVCKVSFKSPNTTYFKYNVFKITFLRSFTSI